MDLAVNVSGGQIQVNAVLSSPGLWHPLEEQSRYWSLHQYGRVIDDDVGQSRHSLIVDSTQGNCKANNRLRLPGRLGTCWVWGH